MQCSCNLAKPCFSFYSLRLVAAVRVGSDADADDVRATMINTLGWWRWIGCDDVIRYCEQLTDAAVEKLQQSCSSITHYCFESCKGISYEMQQSVGSRHLDAYSMA